MALENMAIVVFVFFVGVFSMFAISEGRRYSQSLKIVRRPFWAARLWNWVTTSVYPFIRPDIRRLNGMIHGIIHG